jgi:microcystin-dependent protein
MSSTYNVAPNPFDNGGSTTPIGAMFLWGSSVIPTGFFACDGTAVSRTVYSSLFSVLGTSYGVGDGTSTFNLPNTSGRVVRGSGAGYALGSSGGADAVTIAAVNLPNHSHTLVDPSHVHQQRAGGNINIISSGGTPVQGNVDNVSSADTFSAVTGITMTQSLLLGGTQVTQTALTTVDPYAVINYIIRAT